MDGLGTQAGMARSGSPVAASIVSLWDFESGGRTDDSKGLNDLSGNGVITYSSGKIGDAASGFSNSNYLDTNSLTGFTAKGGATYSGWFKTSGVDANEHYMIVHGESGAASGSTVRITIENGTFKIRVIGGFYASSSNAFNDDNYHFFTVIVPPNSTFNEMTIIVDGSIIAGSFSSNVAINLADPSVFIIGNRAQHDRPFDGSVDQIAVADTEWSLSDHQYVYNNGAGRPTTEVI